MSATALGIGPLSGMGEVTSFTVIGIPPRGRSAEAPYAVAVVMLDGGLSMLGGVVEIPFATIRAGLHVKFRPLVSEGHMIIGFGPA